MPLRRLADTRFWKSESSKFKWRAFQIQVAPYSGAMPMTVWTICKVRESVAPSPRSHKLRAVPVSMASAVDLGMG